MIQPAFEILNQRGTPMFFSDVFANRPTAGIVGRIFISTDTYAFYRDTGSGWDLIGGPGTGTITGSGTSGYFPLFSGSSSIGNSALQQGGGLIYTTNDFRADAIYLTDMSTGNGALWTSGNDLSLANYNPTGKVNIQAGGGGYAIEVASNLNSTFFGNIIRNGGLSTQFLKADGSLDSNTYNTGSGAASQVAFWSGTNALSGENNLWWDSINNYLGINTNTPSVPLDVHHSGNNGAILNQTTATNNNLIAFQTSGNGRWRIGNFYNAGADDYGIFDVVGNIQPFTIAKTTGQTFIGSKITASGRLVVNSASSDAHIQVVGANAPSVRIDNAGNGATQRFVMGLATATNNFIQGSTAGDICISTASASPLLFGMWQSINASEVMRITTANNLLIGRTTDAGYKLDVNGSAALRASGTLNMFVADNSNWSYIQNTGTSTGTNSLGFFVSGATADLFINTGGRTGVGSISPAYKLDVVDNRSDWASRIYNTSSTGYGLLIQTNNSSNNYRAFEVYNSTDEVFIITNGGRIGAGTLTPSGTLDAIGDITQQTSLNIVNQFWFVSRKSRGTAASPSAVLANDEAGGILFNAYDGASWRTGGGIRAKVNSVSVGSLVSNLEYFAGGSSGFSIRMITRGDTGNQLVNTSVDAGYKLSVNGKVQIQDPVSQATYGGFVFFTLPILAGVTTNFFQVPSANYAGITEISWISNIDSNRCGAALLRWGYDVPSGTTGLKYTIYNDSQNSTATFDFSGGYLRITITGGGADYNVQFRIQSSIAN